MSQRTDTSKKFKVKLMTASQTFSFNDQDFEQAVVENTGSVDVYLRDEANVDFVLGAGKSFDVSTIPAKAISGLTVVTIATGTCQIAYLQ
jgi:hypothetical protein